MTTIYARLGLAESLEEYAARVGSTPADARFAWRWHGLRALGAHYMSNGLCVIGGPVRVGPPLLEVLADDGGAP